MRTRSKQVLSFVLIVVGIEFYTSILSSGLKSAIANKLTGFNLESVWFQPLLQLRLPTLSGNKRTFSYQ
jgi:hypothetical protein